MIELETIDLHAKLKKYIIGAVRDSGSILTHMKVLQLCQISKLSGKRPR
jgi:hypothetical protein